MIDAKWVSRLGCRDRYDGTVVAVGTFDGVHPGHRKIVETAIDEARRAGLPSVALTFDPHPRSVIAARSGSAAPELLTTTAERVELLTALGLDEVVVVPFTTEVANLSAEDFVKLVLVGRFAVKVLVIGYDHAFGRGRGGRPDVAARIGKERGFEAIPVGPYEHDGVPIKSGCIRRLIREGDVGEAADLLGRPYRLIGRVVPGEARGRELGYPTVNVAVAREKLLPKPGVMVARVGVDADDSGASADAWYGAMLYVGTSPTFGGGETKVEAYLFDFDDDITGRTVSIEVLERTRDDKRFDSAKDLASAMRLDERVCRARLSELQIV
jgi:riboflavin kinase/FMN adenylyltransferase